MKQLDITKTAVINCSCKIYSIKAILFYYLIRRSQRNVFK